MGRHSAKQKQLKRRNQKRRKRLARAVRSSGDEQSDGSISGCTSDQLSPKEEFRQHAETTDNSLFEALDRVSQDSDDYWEKISEEKIREFDSYRDAHPSIVTDRERASRWYW